MLREAIWYTRPNTVEICITAPSSYNWSVARKLYLKMSLLLTCQILGLFINPLATNEMYPVCNRENLRILSQIQLSEKENNFSQIFPAFFKSMLNFEDFEKKITVTAFVFSKLRTLKR